MNASADPRLVVLQALAAVEEDSGYANLVVPRLLGQAGLGGRDAAVVTDLTYGTLRGWQTYRSVLQACSNRPVDSLDPDVRRILLLGVHELFGQRRPGYAVVDRTVALTRTVVGHRPTGFVNAVLRQVAARTAQAWLSALAPDPRVDPLGALAVRHSHPRWVVEAFAAALGSDLTRVESVLAADNAPPRVVLAARPGRVTVADLLHEGAEPGRWAPTAAVLPGGVPGRIPAVRSGDAGVQDEGSQLVALAFAHAGRGPVPGEPGGERWLDLCAGPGGKAALLAGLVHERGARLVASDLHEHRARLVGQSLSGGPGPWAVLTADAGRPPWPPATFDRVLLDAPCTGLGALRRRPEARWRRQESDVRVLAQLQRSLLRSGLAALRPGGLLAYVTCSPHPAETVDVVESVLAEQPGARLEPASWLHERVPDARRGPYCQLWPDVHGTDAMFLALVRTA